MLGFVKKFGERRLLRALELEVQKINALESEVEKLNEGDLSKASRELRLKIQQHELSLDDALPHAFAFTREAARRTLKQRPFDVQLMGGIVLHQGAISEMATGEGKTLAAVAPTYLNALQGEGVHVVTVNEYLARRDAVWMGQIYRMLGLSVACLVPNGAYLYDPSFTQINADKGADQRRSTNVNPQTDPQESALLDKERDTTGSFLVQQDFLRPISRREAYLADVTYGTNHEFGFDYLRDNLAYNLADQVQRAHHFAIIDEVDSILIDEARTPLIIAAPDSKASDFYKTFARVASRLVRDEDYTVDEKHRSVAITDQGVEKVEKMIGVENIYAPQTLRLVHYLEESLRAQAIFHRDKDYVVRDGEVIIVDEFTGRLLHGRRYNAGLHQAIEAKEGVLVKEESRTYAKISVQNYFRMYKKISGMTGTAQTSAEEFHKVYKREVVSIPTNQPMIRENLPDLIYRTFDSKYRAVADEVKKRHGAGQPILLGTASIEKNEILSAYLSREGIPHEVLNAKNNEREGAIIAQAGKLKGVTVATNVAGRGVDIILGGNPPDVAEAEKVKKLGGLHVIGTERHEARRIDNQLRGRAGRQGDPGSSQFFLSLEDDLLRIFGGERIEGLMKNFNLPEDQVIEIGFVGKAVGQAQAKVEGANFDLRKHLLEYDDVLNKQRVAVYFRRKEILESINKDVLANIIFDAASSYGDLLYEQLFSSSESIEEEKREKPEDALRRVFEEAGIVTEGNPYPQDPTPENLKALLTKRSMEASVETMGLGRVLSILDLLWMNHLEDLEALSESVGLRAYGQKDPLVEYRREAHNLFKNFWNNFNAWIFMNLFKAAQMQGGARHEHVSASQGSAGGRVGRNDPCPCGSGKKYKKCGLLNTDEHQRMKKSS